LILRQLGPRLFVAFLTVMAAGTGTFVLTFRLLAPEVFGRRLQGLEGNGPGTGLGSGNGYGQIIADTFNQSVDRALVVSIIVGAIAAAVVAAFVTRRMVRPVQAIGTTARSLAAGNYSERVAEPEIEELAELARDVNTLAVALSDTEIRRARMMSDVAHELRTPLTSIDGYAEGVVDGIFTEAEMVEAVTHETRRLRRLVDDLSLLSQTSEGSLRLETSVMDPNTVVEDCVERLRPQFDASEVDLRIELAAECEIEGDRDRLGQALTNILGNALLHSEAGGIVRIRSEFDSPQVSVTINDDGQGIDQADIPHLFDRFYRGSGTARPGTGIGLAVADGIVSAHGGTIIAESAGIGLGSSFTIALPAVKTV